MQVQREAGHLIQSFMDHQRLSKLMPDNEEVFAQLQQVAQLCLGNQHHLRQVGFVYS